MTQVEAVDTIPLEAPLEEAFGYSQAWVETRSALLVRVEASDGTVGWGECWGPRAGTGDTVESLLRPAVVGRNPEHVERIQDDLRDKCRAAYQTAVPLPAISGVDIALHDLRGKLLGRSAADLLGGSRRSSVRAYATGHYFRKEDSLEAQYRNIAARAAENADQFTAVKAKTGLSLLGYGPDEDLELVRRIQERIGDTDLMVDANYAYDIGTARRVGRALEEFGVEWFEEPVSPENIDGYAHLREALDIRIAGGECHTPREFDRLFDADGLDVAQPETCAIGGLTAVRRVTEAAKAHDVQVVPHVWGTSIARAAALQFISTLPGKPWLEYDTSPNPLRDVVTKDSPTPDNGVVPVPTGDGLGVTVDESALEEYRVG
jgi:D-galactarolactone cycloisomerase